MHVSSSGSSSCSSCASSGERRTCTCDRTHPSFAGSGKATSSSEITEIKCAGGSEKTELMADPEVTKVLADKDHLKLEFVPMGSYSQVQMPTDDIKKGGYNCLWPPALRHSGSSRPTISASSPDTVPRRS